MATIVLMAAGQALGGPIGRALGAAVGQQIDGRLFGPKARHGPRLGDLAIQTSSYGSQIPKIFGAMRVAGTVIWATDLREHRSSSGGKGQPKTVNYSYSASFAVALSARPVRGVGRIWADGKLLRGAAGDFKTATGFRLHPGDEDQPVDPLIAAAEGIDETPAYRGTAYAVFEDMQLADFGNRIPSLTFEIDAGPASTIGDIARELGEGEIEGGAALALAGYAASGDSVRGAIEALSDVVPLSLTDSGEGLLLEAQGGGILHQLEDEECGARRGSSGGRTEIHRQAGSATAGEVTISYYDPARDYQTGLQRATRGEPAARAEALALPAALDAAAAKSLAEHRLAALWASRARAKVSLAWRGSGLRPGAMLRLEAQAGRWWVERWALDRMVLTLELAGLPGAAAPDTAPASSGRPVGQDDRLHGPTMLVLMDLPLPHEPSSARPYLYAAAAGQEEGWRSAELMASFDAGASWSAAGRAAAGAVIGTAESVPAASGSTLLDERNSLVVELLNGEMWLESRGDDALVAGANLAVLGDELFQFGRAEPLGDRRFRMSRLLRGRRGTEWAASAHQPGERFVLLEEGSLVSIEAPPASVGAQVSLLASGLGDEPEGVAEVRTLTGEGLRPPAPVHLRAVRLGSGDIAIDWVRRSRSGWAWVSGADAPLGEEQEAYRLVLSGAGFERAVLLSSPSYTYTAAEQSADGFSGVLAGTVTQLGTAAPSRPAEFTFVA